MAFRKRYGLFMHDQEKLITELVANPLLAHAFFFGDRHKNETPAFHKTIIRDWHSQKPRVLDMAFRGAAKSTLAEEAITIIAALKQARNIIILGENEARAVDRLKSVKYNFESDERFEQGLGVSVGDIWTETRATLTNGVIIQAYGRGQSLRGVKHIDQRPDLAFADDLEDKESVATPESRRKTMEWFASVLIPAMETDGRIRMAATPLNPEALAPTIARTSQWLTRVFPIVYKGETGEWEATWPDRYPVAWALAKWEELKELGRGEDFVQEYLCQATDPASQTFTEDMFRITPRARSWHAVYAMYDPARTTNKQSATTGKAVCSWIGRKLVVWESFARKMMPDEIVADIFRTDEEFSPVAIGFEEDGLNEWALQPIRAEQIRRGYTVPLRPLKAPRGKLDFIRGLQPYFKAGEVEFATDMPDLRKQLLGFPTGLMDAPNALAYMLRMKTGAPIYENFREELIDKDVRPIAHKPIYLCLNSDGRTTSGALVQLVRSQLAVFADWLYEGDAGQTLQDILESVRLELPQAAHLGKLGARGVVPSALRPVAPREHFDDFSTLSLRAVARKLKLRVAQGGDANVGREEIRALMRRTVHDRPGVAIHPSARWTLRAFAGGYARDIDKADPQDTAYRVLMGGLESFAAMLIGDLQPLDSKPNYAYTGDGRKYISALARTGG